MKREVIFIIATLVVFGFFTFNNEEPNVSGSLTFDGICKNSCLGKFNLCTSAKSAAESYVTDCIERGDKQFFECKDLCLARNGVNCGAECKKDFEKSANNCKSNVKEVINSECELKYEECTRKC